LIFLLQKKISQALPDSALSKLSSCLADNLFRIKMVRTAKCFNEFKCEKEKFHVQIVENFSLSGVDGETH
jgi:hypothetical protein